MRQWRFDKEREHKIQKKAKKKRKSEGIEKGNENDESGDVQMKSAKHRMGSKVEGKRRVHSQMPLRKNGELFGEVPFSGFRWLFHAHGTGRADVIRGIKVKDSASKKKIRAILLQEENAKMDED